MLDELTARLGTAVQAIEFALLIDDHFDMRQFLEDWQVGAVATNDEYSEYWEWLERHVALEAKS